MACELYDTTARPTVDGIGGYIELEPDICHSTQELRSKLLPLFSTVQVMSCVLDCQLTLFALALLSGLS